MSHLERVPSGDEKTIQVPDGENMPGHDMKDVVNGNMEGQIDPKKEKILLAKLDLFFTPIIMLVYLSCFLDRANIVC